MEFTCSLICVQSHRRCSKRKAKSDKWSHIDEHIKMKTIKLRSIFVICLFLMTLAMVSGQPPKISAVNGFETRCGWFSNPTPANAWLDDREGEWIISVQGGHQAEGEWPVFKRGQWVRTNAGSYGYGCACLKVRVNHQTREVLEIKTATARPLAACRKDQSLKEPK